jgi:poly-gamma-glutamate synthesis protein (capsule biosynthesis protein)
VTSAAKEADLVIVSVHWGGEYQAAPSPRQQSIANALAGAGAGLIIGHGPHVLQRVEWIGETLVAYSLGNFLFDQPYPADCRWGAILLVTRFAYGSRLIAQVLPTTVEQGRVRPASPVEAPAILDHLALEHRVKQ